jgi:hypothetical protein
MTGFALRFYISQRSHKHWRSAMAGKNQGEGDREAAKRYNDATEQFVKSGKVDKAAHEATEDPAAEAKGRSRAKEFDPETRRDYTKPTK